MKALLTLPDLPRELSARALESYLTLLWVPEPDTILQAVRKLPAGHWMSRDGDRVTLKRYWDLELREEPSRTDADMEAQLRDACARAIARTTLADVPVSAFLSGGLDSSLITACAAGVRRPVEHEAHDTFRFFTRDVDLQDLRPRPWFKRWPLSAWRVFLATAFRLSPARRILFRSIVG